VKEKSMLYKRGMCCCSDLMFSFFKEIAT